MATNKALVGARRSADIHVIKTGETIYNELKAEQDFQDVDGTITVNVPVSDVQQIAPRHISSNDSLSVRDALEGVEPADLQRACESTSDKVRNSRVKAEYLRTDSNSVDRIGSLNVALCTLESERVDLQRQQAGFS
jgi:hypothetical protein